jgi:hypothetical protein
VCTWAGALMEAFKFLVKQFFYVTEKNKNKKNCIFL